MGYHPAMPVGTTKRDEPDATHPVYDAALPLWQRVRDFAAGADAIRAAGEVYLPKPPEMGNETYKGVLQAAPIFSAVERTLEALLGSAYQADPEVSSAPIPAEQLEDVTGAGDPLLQLSRDVLREILTLARVAVEVMPDENGVPRWRVRPAETLISWRVERVAGEEVLQRAVIRLTETRQDGTWRIVTEPVLRVLVLQEGVLHAQTWRRKADRNIGTGAQGEWELNPEEDVTPMVAGRPMDYIPLAITGEWNAPAKPPLRALAEINRAHYVISAYREHYVRKVAAPTPVLVTNQGRGFQPTGAPVDASGLPVADGSGLASEARTGVKSVLMGSDNLWQLEEGEDLKYVEIKVGGLGGITDVIDERQAQMQALGGRLVFGPAPAGGETATAAAIRHAADVSVLVTATDMLQEVMTRALRWHAQQFRTGANVSAVTFAPNREFLRPPEPVNDDGEGADEE